MAGPAAAPSSTACSREHACLPPPPLPPLCSSVTQRALRSELGPFRPLSNVSLAYNEYTWLNAANMLFIDQPVGAACGRAGGAGRGGL
jgi:hypothetical protein